MKYILFLVAALTAWTSSANATIDYYQQRYRVPHTDTKLVDNRGNGFEELYGTRNFRAVLDGVVYRGGANNYYHRSKPRANSNPLPKDGLENLCREGFGTAVYLYRTNFKSAPNKVKCKHHRGGKHTLQYLQKSPHVAADEAEDVLNLVYAELMSPAPQPIYLHCWNGWHASGYISALVLRQFCGYTAEEAVAYWDRNTDGFNDDPSYEKLRNKIRQFKPSPARFLPPELQSKVCFATRLESFSE